MISPKFCKNNLTRRSGCRCSGNPRAGPRSFQSTCTHCNGIILVDVLLALSLGGLFIAIITTSAIDSRQLLERSMIRNELLDRYASGTFETIAKPYGNERTENIQTVTIPGMSSFTNKSLEFVKIERATITTDLNSIETNAAGTPLCAVEFSNTLTGSLNSATSSLKITPVNLPIEPAMPLTDLAVRDGIAYISADSTKSSDTDLFIVDIRDPIHAKILSSLNTGPGIAALALAGKRIYAAAASTAGQLQIIRMDSPTNINLETKFRLPLPYATTTPTLPSSIFYNSGKVFLGTEKWDGNELNIIGVSQPTHPVKIGGVEIGGKVNDIFAMNGIAYIAAADQNQLSRVDVHGYVHPLFLDRLNLAGWQRQEGKAVNLFEDSLGLGRTSGGYDIPEDHEAFAWATSSLLTLASPSSLNVPGGVYGLIADRTHIYLATRQSGKEFDILDRNLNASTSISYSLPSPPQTMTCDGRIIYVLSHTLPTIYEITF